PEVERIDRLHVVVAVEEKVPPARPAVADHHRMARRRARGGIEPETAQVLGQPVGGPGAIRLEGWIGGNGRNAQEREETLHRFGQGFVDARQDGVEGHGGAPPGVGQDGSSVSGIVQTGGGRGEPSGARASNCTLAPDGFDLYQGSLWTGGVGPKTRNDSRETCDGL